MMEYICDINNYDDPASLNNRLTYEVFWGEIPDISMICSKFWGTLYYWNWTNKEGEFIIQPMRFVGFACNIVNPMTFKVIKCNTKPHKCNIMVPYDTLHKVTNDRAVCEGRRVGVVLLI